MATTAPATSLGWRTPAVIIGCGCLMAILTFGPRSVFGFFLQPMSQELGWGRDVFALAVAIQNLLWGAALPFAGAIADRYGTVRSLAVGAMIYAAGLALMAYSTTPAMLHLSAGVLVGFGLAGASFTIVLAAFGKLLAGIEAHLRVRRRHRRRIVRPVPVLAARGRAAQQRRLAADAAGLRRAGAAGAAARVRGCDARRWTWARARRRSRNRSARRSAKPSAINPTCCWCSASSPAASTSPSSPCTLPPYLVDRGLDVSWGGWVLAFIGLFNIFGAISAGLLGGRFPKRYLLSMIYFLRAVAITAFLLAPMSPASALLFGAAMGVLWLSTVPLTSALVALMFGTRFMATLFGFVFFSHQVGAFLGVWLGGLLYERTGSYDVVWWLGVALGIFAALVHLPIRERPVERLAAAPA